SFPAYRIRFGCAGRANPLSPNRTQDCVLARGFDGVPTAMSIYRDKERGCYVFEFDRVIEGKRVRARKLLPKTWTRAQADAYDRQESARLYAIATRVERHEYSIEDA